MIPVNYSQRITLILLKLSVHVNFTEDTHANLKTNVTSQVYNLFQRPVKQVHFFGGWVEGAKSLWRQDFVDRQSQSLSSQMHKVGTKVCEPHWTDK